MLCDGLLYGRSFECAYENLVNSIVLLSHTSSAHRLYEDNKSNMRPGDCRTVDRGLQHLLGRMKLRIEIANNFLVAVDKFHIDIDCVCVRFASSSILG